MSKKGKLRISNRYQEIVTILQKAKASAENYLWKVVKTSTGERRQKYSILIREVDAAASEINMEVSEAATRDLEPGEKVYFKLVSRNSAFKATVLRVGNRKVVTTFPEEVAVTELREMKRYYFHPVDEKYAQLKRVQSGVMDRAARSVNVLVCDVSQGGLALFVPDSGGIMLDLQHKILLEMLGPFRLETPMNGEVVFKIPFTVKEAFGQREGYKIGIQLAGKIPLATFERFAVKKKMASVDDERIVQDEKVRAQVHENMNVIRESLHKNPKISKFFENLTVPKVGNAYLKHHIELLCEVLCGLALKLGWISERSIDKLIYVAYLHDIRFTQYPKVARIATMSDFEDQKGFLSDNERKAFLESPAYSSELARQDLAAYPDAIKMLLQQKELPDGTGFPHSLMSMQLAPLSCLFIVSHYFVDYVIDHDDWSVDDFVKTYQKKFKGQYFQKIFEAMRK